MAVSIRFVDPLPIPETMGVATAPPTILEIAPCLGETGKRLLDAGELYRLFLALVNGTLPIPIGPFGGIEIITGPGNVVLIPGIHFVPVRQLTAQAITITLPTPITAGYMVQIKDSLGVCFAHNFTINTRDGTLIDLLPQYVFINAFQGQVFTFDGTGWGVT